MKKRFFALIIFVLTWLIAETLLRLLGFSPEPRNIPPKITSIPSPLFQYDSVCGYSHRPGHFVVTLNGALSYTLSIDANLSRNIPLPVPENLPRIALYGCSFWAGMGVNDTEVLSYYLQKMTDSFQIVNFAVPGHGMTSELLLLNHQIRNHTAPKIAVFSLASFHLNRNPAAYSHVKNFRKVPNMPAWWFPRAYFNNRQELCAKLIPVPTTLHPGANYSVVLNAIYRVIDDCEYSKEYLSDLQHSLIDSTASICRKHGIFPLFVLITRDEPSEKMFAHCLKNNYPIIRSNVNYKDSLLHLYPHDGHPNALAHKKYAEEIYRFLHNTYLIGK